jgi:hypothetical protein
MGSSASSLCTFLPTRWPFGRLRSGLPCRTRGVGFPEFTRSFNHGFPWKLHSGVNFTMAVGAQEHAFAQLLADLLPASRVAPAGDPEILLAELRW